MPDPKNMRDLIAQLIAPVNSNENQILETDAANPNEPSDLRKPPAKSGQNQNLEIYPGQPDIAPAHRALRCHHVKPDGLRCGSPALRDEIYCYFHRIWRTQPDCQPHRPDPNGTLVELPLLENANGVQLALQQVLTAVIANKMDLRRANTLLYGLQTAASNVRRTNFDRVAYHSEIVTELK